jgi:hypothetical protein
MSALGHKRTLAQFSATSALPPKADIEWRLLNVRFVPIADTTVTGASSVTDFVYSISADLPRLGLSR